MNESIAYGLESYQPPRCVGGSMPHSGGDKLNYVWILVATGIGVLISDRLAEWHDKLTDALNNYNDEREVGAQAQKRVMKRAPTKMPAKLPAGKLSEKIEAASYASLGSVTLPHLRQHLRRRQAASEAQQKQQEAEERYRRRSSVV